MNWENWEAIVIVGALMLLSYLKLQQRKKLRVHIMTQLYLGHESADPESEEVTAPDDTETVGKNIAPALQYTELVVHPQHSIRSAVPTESPNGHQ